VKDKLEFEVLAWTPAQRGRSPPAVNVVLPDQPTEAELTKYLDNVKASVQNAIVLVGRPRLVPVNITPPAKRRPDEQVKQQYDPNAAPGEGRVVARTRARGDTPAPREGALSNNDVTQRVNDFLLANNVALRINDAAREHGQIIAFQNRNYDIAKSVPTIVMRNEDYGRIARILSDGTPVELEFNIVNTLYPEGKTAYSTISEIAGSDKKDEIVMLGGHLDSWHSATGATDNAIGCAVMMEAARILKAIGVKPRRTIRVALWSVKNKGCWDLRRSEGALWVFRATEAAGDDKLMAYLNIDSGRDGRVARSLRPRSGHHCPRNSEAVRGLRRVRRKPSTSRSIGGTDHTSFNNVGLTGIGFQQDPIDAAATASHEPRRIERNIEQDVKQSAITIASVVYHLAMRDEMLPRFPADKMPPLPQGRGGRGN
jgi:hypothetical protein